MGEEVGIEGREAVIRIYCVKKSIFNKKCVNALERA